VVERVDAEQVVMVVDACHSAAAVEVEGSSRGRWESWIGAVVVRQGDADLGGEPGG